ncbi:MAG: efflux transporter outer membrane subunit [Pseudomonadota bacterium]
MLRPVSLCAWVTACTLMVGCATPGPKQVLDPITADRASWAALTDDRPTEPVTENWLDDLADPMVEDVIETALLHNLDLAASAARVQSAREQARITRADQLPTLGLSASTTRGRNPPGGFLLGGEFIGSPDPTYFNEYRSRLELNWEIDVWGRLTDLTRAGYLDAAAQNFDYAAAQLSLAGNTAQNHYALTAARLQRQLAERDVETGEANLRVIQRRYQRGISSSLDLRLARSSLASSKATLEQRQQQELETARGLEILLGRYPAADIVTRDALPNIAPILLTGSTTALGTPEALLDRRPDIIAAERRLKAAGLRVSAARKAFLPALSLQASAEEQSGSAFSDILDIDALTTRLIGNATQPLFQGGRLIAGERSAKATARAALYDYGNTVLTAWREVEDAIAAERFLSLREDALALGFQEAVAVEEITRRRYLAGTVNIFDFIDSQQRRIQAEGQLIDAKRARLSNRVDLYLALGAPFIIGEEAIVTADKGIEGEGSALGEAL